MKIKYDPQVDALYITFKKRPTQVTTLHFSEDVAIDLGPHDEIVGIEILGASDHLALERLTRRFYSKISSQPERPWAGNVVGSGCYG